MFQAELAHTLMKYLRAGQLDSSNVLQVFLTGIHLVQDYIPVSIDAHEAMIEGIRQNHSPYDMLYFVLARRTGATLLTHDKQLQKLCLRQSVAFAADIPFPDEE
jgi:predicted nucleic acid-binding protein